MKNNFYIDFHVIQTVPPSCINRDDTGSPKTAVYGGTLRARVSSQAWKRAMRISFKDIFESYMIGYRTRKIVSLVADKISAEDNGINIDKAEKIAADILKLAGIAADSDKKEVLFFVSASQIEKIASLAIEYQNDTTEKKEKEKSYKNRIEKALNDDPSIDIRLFGRMAAGNPSLNYDAAAQVAHSISTHTISNEYDYFTAVDDCISEDNVGAGHIGTVEFNSSTLYRYATVNVAELADKLTVDELKMAVKGFADAFVRSMPTGKQNTFANRTLPDMVYVTIRDDQPINLVGAFEKPVIAGEDGFVRRSESELLKYAHRIYNNYAAQPKYAWIVGDCKDDAADHVVFSELLENVADKVGQYGEEGK